MNENQQTVVGIDVGTTTVRCAIGVVREAEVQLVGVGEAPNKGLRKGTVIDINETVKAIDTAVAHAERMAGLQVETATVNINGRHISGVDSKGIIAVSGHEVTEEDLARVEDAATVLQLPASQEIISVFPRSYNVDGVDGVKDPVGMSGTRLEVDAHVVTLSGPVLRNLEKVMEASRLGINRVSVSGLACAQSLLTTEQQEHGVMILDIGASTTNLIVIEDGDVQHVAVIDIGGTHVTNDLAIGLKTELNVAEAVKRNYKHLDRPAKDRPKHIKVVVDRKEYVFPTKDIDLVITSRMEELFEEADRELVKVHRSKKLPGGVTLAGGGSEMVGIEVIASESLELSVRVGTSRGIAGLKEKLIKAEYSTVAGLMLLDSLRGTSAVYGGRWLDGRLKQSAHQAHSLVKRLLGRLGF